LRVVEPKAAAKFDFHLNWSGFAFNSESIDGEEDERSDFNFDEIQIDDEAMCE
jgi:hypothetical protein